VIADPLPAAFRLDTGENVEAGFEPVGEAVSDFEGFVHRMMGGLDAILHGFAAIRGEIGGQLDHGGADGHKFGAVDLNLVVVLAEGHTGDRRQETQ